jgi:predicted nucleic acid-binding protein
VILYLDTSSLVKAYLEEMYSDLVHEWVKEAACVATSRVAYAEALSAFARRHAQGDVDDHKFELIQEVLAIDWTTFILVPVQEKKAGALAVKHVLRGFDAIHLAAAEGLDTLYLTVQDGLVMEQAVEYG